MAVTLESLKKSVGKKNSKSKIFAWLADLELAAGDLDSALQRVNGGLTLYPNDIAAKIVRAKVLFQKGDFEDCVHECESILVKDPFSLAAQKIMGDAYDQLGKVVERNLCYRRYHDMDPLNSFWKEEYDVVPEAAAMAAGAGLAVDEFSMPAEGESLDLNLSDEAAESESSEEFTDDGLFEKSSGSMDSLGDGSLSANPFEKSSEADSLSFGNDDSVEDSVDKAFGDAFGAEADDALDAPASSSPFTSSFLDEEPAAESAEPAAPAAESFESVEDSFGMDSSSSDDPFAALAAMLPNNDAADDATMDELSASLDSVMDSFDSDTADKPVEEFPVDDNVSGNDVNAALSDMFGLDEDLEAEEVPAAKADSFSTVTDEKAEENASKIFETQPSSDKPMSVDDAFDSIFGEDELPDEAPAAEPAVAEDVAVEPFAAEPAIEDVSIEEPVFEKSVEEPAAEVEAPAAPAAPAADKPLSVDDAFDSIFGEDELPDEAPAADPAVVEETADSLSEIVEPAEEPKFVAEVDVPTDPVIASPMDFMNDDDNTAVGSAFDSIFGAEDDLPEENTEKIVETADEAPVAESSLAEQVDLAEVELEMPAVEGKSESSDIAREMGGAFASMFGDDDDLDLPDLKGEKDELVSDDSADQQLTSAAFEENVQAPAEENISSDLDKSFDSLFGSDDDLSLPAEEKPVAGNPDLSSLETEVSGAFKGLFDMEDDSLTEESKPSNSGVDFLMSGDSDDEISAGLIKNPDAPLDRGSLNLDDSMGTRTLAEIYFDQGLYADALKMYQELVQREPENEELQNRMAEIEKICRDKFGGNA